MSEEIDWTSIAADVKASTDLVPPGRYTLGLVSADSGITSKNELPFVNIQFAIESGPHKGRRIYNAHYLGGPKQKQDKREATTRMFFRAMKAYGIEVDYFTENKPSMEAVASYLEERNIRCDADIFHDEHEGKVSAKVKGLPYPASTSAPSEAGAPDLSAMKEFTAPAPKASPPIPNIPSAF
jgi:hypothetical protein